MKTTDAPPASRTGSCPLRCYLIVAANAAAFLVIMLLVLVRNEFRGELQKA